MCHVITLIKISQLAYILFGNTVGHLICNGVRLIVFSAIFITAMVLYQFMGLVFMFSFDESCLVMVDWPGT